MKKYTIEFVREYVESYGYELLSEEYKSTTIKLKMRCPEGHEIMMSWGMFYYRNQRCPVCSKTRKKTIGEVRSSFKDNGYTLLTTEYINSRQKLKFVCPNEHKHSISWGSWNSGVRCGKCSKNIKAIFKDVKKSFSDCKYTLLENKYINGETKMMYQCPLGHIHSTTYCRWKSGNRCPFCWAENNHGENHPNWKNYSESDLQDLELYRAEVKQLTNHNFAKYYYLINSEKLPRSTYEYHLDHRFSVIDGFNNNIPVEIISNPLNLEMLWCKDNLKKQGQSSISETELYVSYKIYDSFIRSEN